MKDYQKNLLLGLFLVFNFHQAFSKSICSDNQTSCIILQERSKVCEYAETQCQQWANDIQSYPSEIPSYLLRNAPWNSTCSYEEKFCILTSQCINKTDSCTLETMYQGTLPTVTPWGEQCVPGKNYCPVLGTCIPTSKPCSFQELNNFLQQPNSYAYFNTSCNVDEVFCPGTQTCISNTTDCSYNASLSFFASNMSCPGSETFCMDERKCLNTSCTPQSRPYYNVTDRGTGWKLFCDNFKYICPKTILNARKCKANGMIQDCTPVCDHTPVDDCKCQHDHQYKCILKAKCINNTMPCSEPPSSSVCGPSPSSSVGEPFSSFVVSDMSSAMPMPSMSEFSVSPTIDSMSIAPESTFSPIDQSSSLMMPDSSIMPEPTLSVSPTIDSMSMPPDSSMMPEPSVSPTMDYSISSMMLPESSMMPSVSPSPVSEMPSIIPSLTYAPPVCSYVCGTGRNYCPLLNACVLNGYSHCYMGGNYCAKGYTNCNGKCEKTDVCPTSSIIDATSYEPMSTNAESVQPSSVSLIPLSSFFSQLSSSSAPPSSSSPAPISSSSSPSPSLGSSSSSPAQASSSSSPAPASSSSSPAPASSSSSPAPPSSSSSSAPTTSSSSPAPASSSSSPAPTTSSSSPTPASSSSSAPTSSSSSPAPTSSSSSPAPASSSSSPAPASSSSSPAPASSSSSPAPASSSSSPAQASSSSSPAPASSSSSPAPASSSSSSAPASSSSSPAPASPSSSPAPTISSSSPAHTPSSSLLAPAPTSSSSPALASLSSSPTPTSSSSPEPSSSPSLLPPLSSSLPRPSPSPLPPSFSSIQKPSIHVMSSKFDIHPSPSAIKPSPVATHYFPSATVKPPRPTVCISLHFLLQLRGNTLPLTQVLPAFPASKNIAITGLQGSIVEAKWQAYYSGSFHVIDQTTISHGSALVLAQTDKLRLDSKLANSTFHGPVFVNVSFVSPTTASGSRINASSLENACFVILFLPDLPAPAFKIKKDYWKLYEDDAACKGKVQVSQLVEGEMPNVNFKNIAFDPNNTYMQQFKTEVDKYKSTPRIIAKGYSKGKLEYIRNGVKTAVVSSSTPIYLQTTDYLCFTPDRNFYGNVTVELQNCYKTPIAASKCHKTSISIRVEIDNVDDQFLCNGEFPKNFYSLYLLEQNQMVNPAGIMIGTITGNQSIVYDIDGGRTGLAVAFAVNSSYGHYEYRLDGDVNWKTLLVTSNSRPYGQSGQTHLNLIFLDQKDWIRFVAYSNTTGWTERDAILLTSIYAFAWNPADNRGSGMQPVNLPSNVTQLCARFPKTICCRLMRLETRRKQAISGCDRKPGSTRVFDACGVCGGKNDTCRGCDGVPNSGAIWDDCGECTGNSTGKAFNYLKDCAGECNKSVIALCGVCQLKSQPVIDFRDCAGVCNGNATRNCGYCVGGNTTRNLTYGMDACGVCGGDNSKCTDCSGVVNGKKKRDLCGQCLLENDPSFDNGCTKLGRVSHSILPNSTVHTLQIPAAGIDQYSSVACEFVAGSLRYAASSNAFKLDSSSKKKGITLATPASIDEGIYQVECKFDGSVTKTAANTVQFYYLNGMQVNSVSPTNAEYNKAVTVTISGDNFFNSSELVCITKRNRIFSATFISSTAIQCDIPALPASDSLFLSPSFSAKDRSLPGRKFVKFDMYANVATIRYCKFGNNLRSILIKFSKASKPTTKTKSCAVFLSNTGKLGIGQKCYFIDRTTFMIEFGLSATITPSESLTFLSTNIKDFSGKVTKYQINNDSCTIQQPDTLPTPKIKLQAPPTIGVCSKTKLIAKQPSGAGGRPLTITWSAMVDSSYTVSLTSVQRAAVEAINQTLTTDFVNQRRVKLNANSSLINVKIRYMVTVRNFLGVTNTFHKIVTRINSNVPSINVGEKERSMKVSENLILQVKTEFEAKCLQGAGTLVIVKWSVDVLDLTLTRTDKKKILLKGGSLQPGRTYVFTVSVTMGNDPSSSVSDTITVTTISSALICRMKVPSTIGFEESLELDGGLSSDPDSTSESEAYRWEVLDKDSDPYYVRKDGKRQRMIFNGKKITFQVKQYLLAGQTYVISLTYLKGSRNKAITQTLVVISKIPPKLFIQQPNAKLDTSKPVVIKAKVCGVGKLAYKWDCQQGCNDFGLSDSGVAMNALSGERYLAGQKCFRADIGINANKLDGGATYELNLTCTSPTATVSSAVTFQMNAPPSTGTITVSPANGTATQTLFTLQAMSDFADDSADYPLTYTFCYSKSNDESCFTPLDEGYLSDQTFPPGDPNDGHRLTVTVYVSDKYGATTSKSTTIIATPPPPKSDADYAAEVSSLTTEISQDPLIACAKITVSIQTEDSVGGGGSISSQKVADTQNLAVAVMSQASSGAVPTKEGKNQLTATIVVVFKFAGPQMDKGTKLDMTVTMVFLMTGVSPSSSSSKRRRRASSPPAVDPITAAQAEKNLIPFQSLDANLFDSSSQTSKQNFLTYLDALMAGMCGNMIINQSPAIARSTVVVIQTYYKDFLTINNTAISLGDCADCNNYITGPSSWFLGNSLINQYSSYTCDISKGTSCSGACIASAQMKEDFLSTSLNSSRISDVLRVKLLNPETADHAELAATGLAEPMIVKIPISRTTNGSYQCHIWDSASGSWVQNGIYTVSQSLTVSGNSSYVSCAVNKTAYISIFEGPAIPTTTTAAPTTLAATTSNVTTAAIDYTGKPSLEGRFSFNVNCLNYLQNASETAKFISAVRKTCAAKLNVPESALQQFNATCGSIVITFKIFGHLSNSTLDSVNASLQTLKSLISSGSLQVILSDGRNITADPTSFVIIIPATTTAPTTNPPTTNAPTTKLATKTSPPSVPGKKGLSGGAIAGIVIGVLVGLAIIAAIVYFVVFRKKTKQNPAVEPDDNVIEMDEANGNGIKNKSYEGKV